MKTIMILLFPLLILNFCLWWQHHHRYYETFYPRHPEWQAFLDMWREV